MKNINGIIESFGAVADKIPHDLIVVGNDWKVFVEELFFSQIDYRLRKRIKFKENVSDEEKCCLFKNAEMLIFPSLYEGFGLPPIEAMACGCPVIVSNNSSLPEIFGNGAYYFNPENIKEISAAILHLIKDSKLRNELTEKGKERALHFRWDFSAVKHLWLLEQIIDSSTFPVVETHPLLQPAWNCCKREHCRRRTSDFMSTGLLRLLSVFRRKPVYPPLIVFNTMYALVEENLRPTRSIPLLARLKIPFMRERGTQDEVCSHNPKIKLFCKKFISNMVEYKNSRFQLCGSLSGNTCLHYLSRTG